MIRIKLTNFAKYPKGMGEIIDVDDTSYRAVEVQIHTPGLLLLY